MAGTPEDDLLGWLEREEQSLGFGATQTGLEDLERARTLFYNELGYDLTEGQFAGLKQAQFLRYEELPSIGVGYSRIERSWGYQESYRDVTTGRFISREDVYSLLSTIR